MSLFDALAQSIEPLDVDEGRQYGLLAGIVLDNADPLGLCRVTARIGSQQGKDSTDWLIPAGIGSIEAIPRVGDAVLVAFVDGDPHRGVYMTTLTTKSRQRATEPLALGLSLVGLFNYLVDQFNTLRSDYKAHTHGGVTSGSSSTLFTSHDTSSAASKGLSWDGATVASVSSSKRVLSKDVLTRAPEDVSSTNIPQGFKKR